MTIFPKTKKVAINTGRQGTEVLVSHRNDLEEEYKSKSDEVSKYKVQNTKPMIGNKSHQRMKPLDENKEGGLKIKSNVVKSDKSTKIVPNANLQKRPVTSIRDTLKKINAIKTGTMGKNVIKVEDRSISKNKVLTLKRTGNIKQVLNTNKPSIENKPKERKMQSSMLQFHNPKVADRSISKNSVLTLKRTGKLKEILNTSKTSIEKERKTQSSILQLQNPTNSLIETQKTPNRYKYKKKPKDDDWESKLKSGRIKAGTNTLKRSEERNIRTHEKEVRVRKNIDHSNKKVKEIVGNVQTIKNKSKINRVEKISRKIVSIMKEPRKYPQSKVENPGRPDKPEEKKAKKKLAKTRHRKARVRNGEGHTETEAKVCEPTQLREEIKRTLERVEKYSNNTIVCKKQPNFLEEKQHSVTHQTENDNQEIVNVTKTALVEEDKKEISNELVSPKIDLYRKQVTEVEKLTNEEIEDLKENFVPRPELLKFVKAMKENIDLKTIEPGSKCYQNAIQDTLRAVFSTINKYPTKNIPSTYVSSPTYNKDKVLATASLPTPSHVQEEGQKNSCDSKLSPAAQLFKRRAESFQTIQPLERALIESQSAEMKFMEKRIVQEQSELPRFFRKTSIEQCQFLAPIRSQSSSQDDLMESKIFPPDPLTSSFDTKALKIAQRYSDQLEQTRMELTRRLNAL